MLRVGLVLALAVGNAPPSPDESAPGDATSVAPAQTVVAPLTVEGTLPPEWNEALRAALDLGLRRAQLQGEAPTDCATHPCPAPPYRVETSVGVDDRSYTIEIVVRRQATGAEVLQVQASCEVCGLSEVQDVITTLAATLRERLDRLNMRPPRLRITSDPAGARVYLDTQFVGTTPLEHTDTVGPHRVRLVLSGHRAAERNVELAAGLDETLSVELLALPPPPKTEVHDRDLVAPRRSAAFVPVGWALIGAGVAGVATGGTLVGIDGRSARYRCSGPDLDIEGNCRFVHRTQTAGLVVLTSAAVGIITGVTLLVIGKRRRSESSRRSARRRRWERGG